MYSESLEDQGSDKSNGHMADYQDESGHNNNANSHSDNHEQLHLSNQDEVDGYGSGCDDVEFAEAEMDEQQDDCDRDPLDEIHTSTQLDRENEIPTIKTENGHSQQHQQQQQPDQDVWYLPANREVCTLEEIRRGQVINKTAGNECPVPGCGKKINETRIDPTPGTIASGLRTHVLFVHYGVSPNRKLAKKKKSLGWTSVTRGLRTSPRKLATHTSQMLAATSRQQDTEIDYSNMNSADITNTLSSLIQKSSAPMNLSRPDVDRRFKKSTIDNQQPNINQISSLQSLIQASGGQKTTTSRAPKKQQDSSAIQTNQMNPVTSSLFSILAGITQQQQQQHQSNTSQLQPAPKNPRSTTHNNNNNNINNNSANVPQNRSHANNNRPANSSLLSLLNEKISGNVAFSLQNQLRKTMTTESRSKGPASRQYSDPNSYLSQVNNNDTSYNNGGGRGGGGGTSILNGLISNNGDNRISLDNSIPINSFVETMASKTGSNIGPVGIAQVKKMLEKFTASLLYSSQTIADHYLEPFGGEVVQQKPEISASDVILAYKMMLKTHGQP